MEIGEFVKSTQGRDKENIYMVYGFNGREKVLLVNGNNRTIERPKIKNPKHLISLGNTAENIRQKILTKTTVFDAEIYSAIKKIRSN